MKVLGVARDDVASIAPKLMPFLVHMTDGGRVSAEGLLDELVRGGKQCWLVVEDTTIEAVAITRIYGANSKVCEVAHLSGNNMQAWTDAIDTIEAWAESIGCAELEATARPGFRKLGKHRGFKETHVTLRKRLDG